MLVRVTRKSSRSMPAFFFNSRSRTDANHEFCLQHHLSLFPMISCIKDDSVYYIIMHKSTTFYEQTLLIET